jgi:group II intron reverse transcriptase/maturase
MPDNVGSGQHEQTSLRGIAEKAERSKQHRFRDLFGLLTPGMLLLAWNGLDKKAAIADDDMTVEEYALDLENNLQKLFERLKAKRYKTRLTKRRYIPKENGKKRPLGIPALEDKIVQKAVSMILEAIYEQDFLDCSYGYRPKRSAKDAISDLTFQLQFGVYGYLVEADIKGFFDHINHGKLLEMLATRINDKAFLWLIEKWLKAGILEPEGYVIHPDTGTPQGGIVSPILANVYLHVVLDEWFHLIVKPRLKGRSILYRYADDFVSAFQYKDDAERFYAVLPKRLGRFGLEVEPTKTRIIRFSRFHPSMKRMFSFLGFEIYWHRDRSGKPRVMRRTARKRQKACLRRIKEWIKAERHNTISFYLGTLKRKLVGHYNYYYVRGNSRSVWSFFWEVISNVFKWLNRRSQHKSYSWEELKRVLKAAGIPQPRLTEQKRRCQRVFA